MSKTGLTIYLFLMLGFICLIPENIKGQDAIYSQYYNAPLQLNPAFAGTSTSPILTLNYRNEWPAIPRAYQTYSLSVDKFFTDINSGLGMMLFTDSAGDGIYKTFRGSLVYSYQVKVNEDLKFKIGLETTLNQIRLDWDKLVFFDQIELGTTFPGIATLPTAEERPRYLSKTNLDLSTGLLVYSRQYYAGLTLKHINSPNTGFLGINDGLGVGLPIRISLHAGGQFNLESNNKYEPKAFLSPNILFIRQGDLTQVNAGTLAGLRRFFVGLWYRHTITNADAMIFAVGMRNKNIRISYSYDLTISSLNVSNTGGSHEIGVIIDFEHKGRKKVDYNDCFSIFR